MMGEMARLRVLVPSLALALIAVACPGQQQSTGQLDLGDENAGSEAQGPQPPTGEAGPEDDKPAGEGIALLDFRAPAVGGGTVDGTDYQRRDVMIWFWAPW